MTVEPPVVTPASLTEAYELMARGDYQPIAGGTDLMVQLEADVAEPPAAVLNLWRLDALRGVGYDGYDVGIGALTTWTDLRESPVIGARLPALEEAAATIGAAQIQNRGTIGGNICNASPAGDSLPVLLAVDATFDLGSAAGERSVPAREFWTGYRQTALRSDELLLRVRFPVERQRHTRYRKVGTRAAQAISKVVMALSYIEEDGVWSGVRVALGSVAATTVRAPGTEAILEGNTPSESVADAAGCSRSGVGPDSARPADHHRRSVERRTQSPG